MLRRSFEFRVGLWALCGALGVAALCEGVRTLEAGCAIGWPFWDPTCTVAGENRYFSYTVHTQYLSQNKGSWTLAQALANPGGGITQRWISPTSVGIVEDDQTHTASGEIQTTCSGYLDSPANEQKKTQASAWDATAWECSGARDVWVKPYGQSCN